MATVITARTNTPRKPIQDMFHRYWLGRQRLYSLSRVIRDIGFKPDFGDIAESVLYRAGCRGSLVEYYCYQLLQGRRVVIRSKHCGTLTTDVKERVEAFWRWQQAVKPEFVDAEQLVWNAERRVCWRRDFRAVINGKLTLVDIKTSAKAEKDWILQIGFGLDNDQDGCNKGGVLHLNPRLNKLGYKFREYPAETARTLARRAIDRWRSNKDFNLLKAELGFESESAGFDAD